MSDDNSSWIAHDEPWPPDPVPGRLCLHIILRRFPNHFTLEAVDYGVTQRFEGTIDARSSLHDQVLELSKSLPLGRIMFSAVVRCDR